MYLHITHRKTEKVYQALSRLEMEGWEKEGVLSCLAKETSCPLPELREIQDVAISFARNGGGPEKHPTYLDLLEGITFSTLDPWKLQQIEAMLELAAGKLARKVHPLSGEGPASKRRAGGSVKVKRKYE
jgi:hypothetical protein